LRVDLMVVGAGYVGLTTAVGFVGLGHRVTVHDIDADRIALLKAGETPIFEPGLEAALRDGAAAGRLSFTSEPAPSDLVEMVVVCVPTPIAANGMLDTAIVESVVARLLGELGPGRTIVVRSTLPLDGPDRLEAISSGPARAPIVINPEFMREGRALADFVTPSRVAVGYLRPADRAAAEAVARLYASLDAPLVVADARSIVLVKLASNVFLSLKIAFADELARLCDAIGADVSVVADAVGQDPRIGRAFLDSGPGFGGSCLPEQAAAIAAETARRNVGSPLLSAIATSNTTHQDELVTSIGALLRAGLPNARIALLGLAFKANTDDVRHSPALALARGLRARGATVTGYDPVANAAARRADPRLVVATSAIDAADGADAVVVATEWEEFAGLDWHAIAGAMRGDLVYDTRRRLDGAAVAAAGLRYVELGRAAIADADAAPIPS
jgi:UDPglucose 6-dehydrogenase